MGLIQRVRALGVWFGFALATMGTGLAVYSRFFSSTGAVPEDSDRLAGLVSLQDTPDVVGVAVLVSGVLAILAAIARWCVRNHHLASSVTQSAMTIWLTVLTGFALYTYATDLPGDYRTVREEVVFFERFPTAVGALALVFAGTLLLAACAPRVALKSVGTRAAAVACVLGLLSGVAVSAQAVHLGDDSVNIEHTTATEIAVPPVPATVGEYRYSIPAEPGDQQFVVAAGAGYVVAGEHGITAYDGRTGEERWRYLRTGEGPEFSADSLTTYDGGSVVTAQWDQTIGFDAMTGEVLWAGSDLDNDRKHGFSRADYLGPYPDRVILRFGYGHVSGYDPHTGRRMWDVATDCSVVDAQVTDRAVYYLDRCTSDHSESLSLVALDSLTGEVSADRDLGRLDQAANLDTTLVRVANTVAVEWDASLPERGRAGLIVSNPSQIETAPIAGWQRLEAADPLGPQYLVTDATTPTGKLRIRLAAASAIGMETEIDGGAAALILSEQIVVAGGRWSDSSVALGLRGLDRSDGRELTHRVGPPVHIKGCDAMEIIPAPGVLLLGCRPAQGPAGDRPALNAMAVQVFR